MALGLVFVDAAWGDGQFISVGFGDIYGLQNYLNF
jgi:hypothetical protein